MTVFGSVIMKKRIILFLIIILLLPGCQKKNTFETEFFAMDTIMQMKLYTSDDETTLSRNIIEKINELERELSVTMDDSSVSQLNHGEKVTLSKDLQELLSRTLALHDRTNGCLDPTIFPIVKLWGFTTGKYHVPSESERTSALTHTGIDHIHNNDGVFWLDDGTELDFGAVAKGYASEICAAQINEANISGILTLGGNVQTVGNKPDGTPWQIGITDPNATSESIATLSLNGSNAIVTSGGYQRYFEENGILYCHIMDPSTGNTVQNDLLSVTIVAKSGFLADALSTALYIMGSEKASEFWRSSDDFEVVMLTNEGILISEGLEDVFTCSQKYEVIHR